MKTVLITVFLILFILLSCRKEETPYQPIIRCSTFTRNIDTINNYLQGTWDWAEEYRITRPNGAEYITPKTPNYYHILLKLSGDTAQFFKNGQPDSLYRYRVQRLSEISNFPPDSSIPVIVYYSIYNGQRGTAIPIMMCRDQLLMQHQYVSSIVGERLWLRK